MAVWRNTTIVAVFFAACTCGHRPGPIEGNTMPFKGEPLPFPDAVRPDHLVVALAHALTTRLAPTVFQPSHLANVNVRTCRKTRMFTGRSFLCGGDGGTGTISAS
jgi:hypothetical protein